MARSLLLRVCWWILQTTSGEATATDHMRYPWVCVRARARVCVCVCGRGGGGGVEAFAGMLSAFSPVPSKMLVLPNSVSLTGQLHTERSSSSMLCSTEQAFSTLPDPACGPFCIAPGSHMNSVLHWGLTTHDQWQITPPSLHPLLQAGDCLVRYWSTFL